LEYVAYAIEARRRVKEQMNKRKPDDEFARIELSYIDQEGTEVIVECLESRGVAATQSPVRREQLSGSRVQREPTSEITAEPAYVDIEFSQELEPQEQHFTIMYGDTGHTFQSIVGPYTNKGTMVTIEDPYIRMTHQAQNLVRLCEALLNTSTIKKIRLVTNSGDSENWEEMSEKLEELKQSLLERDVVLEVEVNPNLHDREIRIDNGWTIKIGRGLDIYQKPDGWFAVGAHDLALRPCLETKVDIFRSKASL